MKILAAVFLLCLGLRFTAAATELSLSGTTNNALTNTALTDLPPASISLSTAPQSLIAPQGLTARAGTDWMNADGTPALTLEVPKAAPVMAKMDLTPPKAGGSGLPDSWVCGALGLLLLGLGWACSGYISQHQPERLAYDDKQPEVPPQRVHMLPLRGNR